MNMQYICPSHIHLSTWINRHTHKYASLWPFLQPYNIREFVHTAPYCTLNLFVLNDYITFFITITRTDDFAKLFKEFWSYFLMLNHFETVILAILISVDKSTLIKIGTIISDKSHSCANRYQYAISRAKVQNLLTWFFSFLRFLHIINPGGPMHRLTKSHDPITYIKHVICKKQNLLSCHSENFEAQNLLRYNSWFWLTLSL